MTAPIASASINRTSNPGSRRAANASAPAVGRSSQWRSSMASDHQRFLGGQFPQQIQQTKGDRVRAGWLTCRLGSQQRHLKGAALRYGETGQEFPAEPPPTGRPASRTTGVSQRGWVGRTTRGFAAPALSCLRQPSQSVVFPAPGPPREYKPTPSRARFLTNLAHHLVAPVRAR